MKKILLETSFSKIYIIVMILISILVVGGYFSYAMFTVTKEKSNAISIVTGNLTYELLVDGEETNTLSVPSNSSKVFIVNLTNPNNRVARFNFYHIGDIPNNVEAGYIIDCETNQVPEAKGVNLEKNGTSGSSNIYKIMVENNSNSEITIDLGVNVGLDYNDLTLPSDGHLFNEYKDIPNAPELDDNMIAVKYENNNWVKADTNNANDDWYNYEEQKWANAVTVSSSTRSTYKNASVGTVVSMNDIETMWVWIPRYSYTIGSVDGTNYYGKKGCYLESEPTKSLPGEIDVSFVSNDIKDRGSAKYKTTTGSREYYTPDAFTFGDKELSGIWVGKFETSSSNPSASNGGGNVTNLDPMIKPNVISWRNINVSNAFNVSIKMNDSGNRYGFSSNVDTHMMKNSEWGLVSYLSQSKYGKFGNTDFSGSNKEIYQNKSDKYITGCSYGTPSNGNTDYGCQYTYDIEGSGTGASTTGNVYGIYDMSGGSWEYVISNYNNVVGSSGFSVPLTLDSKYYNLYTSDNDSDACNEEECLSHSLNETGEWYGDARAMINNTYPWMARSGYYFDSISSGIFSFGSNGGANYTTSSFRLVTVNSKVDTRIKVVNDSGEVVDYLKYSDGSYVTTDDTVKIIPGFSDSYAMDVENGSTEDKTNVQIYTKMNTTLQNNAQSFKITDTLTSNYYNIGMLIDTNKVLDVAGGDSSSGANIQIYTNNNTISQKWNFIKSNVDGYYYIKSGLGTCVDVVGGGTTDNTNVQAYTCNQSTAQRWKLEKVN